MAGLITQFKPFVAQLWAALAAAGTSSLRRGSWARSSVWSRWRTAQDVVLQLQGGAVIWRGPVEPE
eukprot:121238-Amphidinium_carterae.1